MKSQKFTLSSDASFILDLIRVISAQMVVVGHLLSFLGISPKTDGLYIQNIGVLVFFILSGFLISYATFGKLEKGYSFKLFFIDRFSRIYAGLIPSLIFVFVIDLVFVHNFGAAYQHFQHFNFKTFFANIFMLEGIISTSFEKILGINLRVEAFGSARPLWSLAVEWWIYMFFGWLVLGQKAVKKQWQFILILGVLAYVPLINVLGGTGNGLSLVWFGGLIIYIFFSKNVLIETPKNTAKIISFLLFIVAILRLKINNYEAYDLVFAYLLAISLYFLLISLLNSESISLKLPLFSKIIKTVANYSFTLYLIHYSICEFLIASKNQLSNLQIIILAAILSNILAYFVAYFTEMKYKKWNFFLKNNL